MSLGRIAVLTILLAAAAVPRGAAQEKPKTPPGDEAVTKLKRAVLDAARKAYQFELERLRTGVKTNPEHLYRWSRRWLEAQRDVAAGKGDHVAAAAEHLKRMETLETMARSLVKAGQMSPADGAGVEFYRVQAELWLEQAKGARE